MEIQRHATVIATDGELGQVTHVVVSPDTKEVTEIVVAHDGAESLVPMSEVSSIDGDIVTLAGPRARYTQAEAFQRDAFAGLDDERVRDETEQTARHDGAPLLNASEGAVEIGDPGAAMPYPASERIGSDQPYHLQLREERLNVSTQEEQAGTVRLSRRITERMETINVPVREERLVIEVVPGVGAGRVRVGDQTLVEGEVIEILLMEEQITVTKEAILKEDITIRKEVTTHTEQVSETLRSEELTVEDQQGLATINTDTPAASRDHASPSSERARALPC